MVGMSTFGLILLGRTGVARASGEVARGEDPAVILRCEVRCGGARGEGGRMLLAEVGLEGTKAATGVEVLDCRDKEETEPREEEEGF